MARAASRPERAAGEQPQRLVRALARLDERSVRDAGATLWALDAALDPDEEVRHVVQGWTKGLPCLVARTDRRLVVVIGRFPEPLVESLHPARTGISLYGPPGADRVSLAVIDGRRLLEVTGVLDRGEATAIRAESTSRTSRGYF